MEAINRVAKLIIEDIDCVGSGICHHTKVLRAKGIITYDEEKLFLLFLNLIFISDEDFVWSISDKKSRLKFLKQVIVGKSYYENADILNMSYRYFLINRCKKLKLESKKYFFNIKKALKETYEQRIESNNN